LLIDRADSAGLKDLATHRQAQWARQREYVAACSPLHRRVWNGREPPRRLEGLAELPLVDKEMLRESQRARPPFGDYLAAPEERIARVHRTSGTTGTAMNLALSAADAHTRPPSSGRGRRRRAGWGPATASCTTSTIGCGWGYTDHAALEATGASVLPFGVDDSELLVRTIRELRITAISCTPSYPAVLERVFAER